MLAQYRTSHAVLLTQTNSSLQGNQVGPDSFEFAGVDHIAVAIRKVHADFILCRRDSVGGHGMRRKHLGNLALLFFLFSLKALEELYECLRIVARRIVVLQPK